MQDVRNVIVLNMERIREMKYKEINLEQGSDAWFNWRNDGIGASDASTIMGENRFKSADKLLHEKIYRINESQNTAMMEGTRLEPEARKAYQKKSQYKCCSTLY